MARVERSPISEKSTVTDDFETELEQRKQQTEEMRRELDLWRAVHHNMRTQRLSDKMPETLHKDIACHR